MSWNVIYKSDPDIFTSRRVRFDTDMSPEERAKLAEMRRNGANKPVPPQPPRQ